MTHVLLYCCAGDAAALLGAAANGASLSIGRLLLLAPYHVSVFAYSFVVTGVLYLVRFLLFQELLQGGDTPTRWQVMINRQGAALREQTLHGVRHPSAAAISSILWVPLAPLRFTVAS